MKKFKAVVGCLLASSLYALMAVYAGSLSAENLAYDKPSKTVHPKLTAHSQTMEQRVDKIAEGVYKAIGYDIANSVMIEGKDGVIIVDVLSTVGSAKQVMEEFRKITDAPVKALVYTHHHGDHINGGPGFINPEDAVSGKVRIFAHKDLTKNLSQQAGMLVPITASRAFFMYGNYLDKGPEGVVNTGIGPALLTGETRFLPPTDLVDERRVETIAGMKVEMVHVPSEAKDEIALWFPEKKVLHAAEVLQGESFPNIYTIRGDVMRDPVEWVRSIDQLRKYPAEILVRSHGRAIIGKENVANTLTAYRDAIQYVHDQTVRYINKGYTPDEIVTVIDRLPPHLLSNPDLQEFYGTVKHSVRAIYNQYLGWFNGDPATLDPLPPQERAKRYVQAMGGRDAVLKNAEKALDDGDFRWAAEVTSYLITLDREDMTARQLKAKAFRPLAFDQINVNWRNFYLSSALEMEGKAPRPLNTRSSGVMAAMPASVVLQHMAVRVDPVKTADLEITGAFELPSGEKYALELRRGVVQFHNQLPEKVDFTVKAAKRPLLGLTLGMRTVDQLVAVKALSVSGDQKAAAQFFAGFDQAIPWDQIPVSLH
ncbi:MAG: alkyl/aryl-sulfatase [Endozoicomonas sp.]|uniref:alkyl/aryl-sulfatase n=1 Tax=Endozoicomonas sp. TaxID=1892382 RepID=UPI003D9B0008